MNLERIKARRAAGEGGFTLIELLVVIIILGILAAVVVFAVGGIGDKGQSSACVIDTRTLRTAEEAYFAKNNTYVGSEMPAKTEQALVTGGFLSEDSEYHYIDPASASGFTIKTQDGRCGAPADTVVGTSGAL